MEPASKPSPRESGRAEVRRVATLEGAGAALASATAVIARGVISADRCASWVSGVYAARAIWNQDFGGEQFSLGRAFYTHFEEEKSDLYFKDAAASDARVESFLPGFQATMRDLVAEVTGARAIPRRGWCGPGVHVFPPDGPVAADGGVVHFDTEGLTDRHARERRGAITLVAMFQPPAAGGGLRVWDVLYAGHDHPTEEELAVSNAAVVYEVGDVVLIDAYRMHQIEAFSGDHERISATVHAAEIGEGLWETWF